MLLFKRLLIIVPLLMLNLLSQAQVKTITGTILSSDDKTPLQGVTVTNQTSGKKTLTNIQQSNN